LGFRYDGAMIACIDIGRFTSPPVFMTAWSKTIPTCDSFCSLLRACASVTRPTTLVSFGTMISPFPAFMSCVTVASTSSPVFTFFASMLLVSWTGITLPGAILGAVACAELAAADGADMGFCCVWGAGVVDGAGVASCAIETPHSRASVARVPAKYIFIECLLMRRDSVQTVRRAHGRFQLALLDVLSG